MYKLPPLLSLVSNTISRKDIRQNKGREER